MDNIKMMEENYIRNNIPDFSPGDLVRVITKETIGDKTRLHRFEGRVISKRGSGTGKTFTVRKIAQGVGVEKIFPVNSPIIDSIKVLKKGKVRRAKLYYLRKKEGKAARIKEKK
ncbi:50S ribosomal protein L19 [candidate division WOR-3 bacterium]|nr:50S ribosomal protein L19 [candidate division WOR-3 bacterium]